MERCEYKFPLTQAEYEKLQPLVAESVPPDRYSGGKPYTISSLYFDDARHKLYYQTLDREQYRYKLRLRVYGKEINADTPSFFEIKSKLMGRSDKKRRAASLAENDRIWLDHACPDSAAQEILRLILQDQLQPSAVVSYERLAYAADGEERLRITFDSALRIRTDRLDLRYGADGIEVMDDCFCVMEVKSGSNLPLWLVRMISSHELANRSYSKYGHTRFDKARSESSMQEAASFLVK